MTILPLTISIVSAILVGSAIAEAAEYQAVSVPVGMYQTTQMKQYEGDESDTSTGVVTGFRYERRNTKQYGGSFELLYAAASADSQSAVTRSSVGLNLAAELFVSPILGVTAGLFFERASFAADTDSITTQSTVDVLGSHAALTSHLWKSNRFFCGIDWISVNTPFFVSTKDVQFSEDVRHSSFGDSFVRRGQSRASVHSKISYVLPRIGIVF
jgi:hypothetical protein